MQLLMVAMVGGAIVSKTTHVVVARVGSRHTSDPSQERSVVGGAPSADPRDAVEELAAMVGLDSSRVDVTITDDDEVHCSIQARPDQLLEVAQATEASLDDVFRERHQWSDKRVFLHVAA